MSRARSLEHVKYGGNATELTPFTSTHTGVGSRRGLEGRAGTGSGERMVDIIRRVPYWRQAKMLAVATIAPVAVVVLGLTYWALPLEAVTLAGMPAAFLLAVHGVAVVAIASVARFALAQERIDRWHRTHDDA